MLLSPLALPSHRHRMPLDEVVDLALRHEPDPTDLPAPELSPAEVFLDRPVAEAEYLPHVAHPEDVRVVRYAVVLCFSFHVLSLLDLCAMRVSRCV